MLCQLLWYRILISLAGLQYTHALYYSQCGILFCWVLLWPRRRSGVLWWLCLSGCLCISLELHVYTHMRMRSSNGPFPGLPRWAGTREVKPVWILLKQETVSGTVVSAGLYASLDLAPDRKPHHPDFYRPDALPAAQPTVQARGKVHVQTSPIFCACYLQCPWLGARMAALRYVIYLQFCG